MFTHCAQADIFESSLLIQWYFPSNRLFFLGLTRIVRISIENATASGIGLGKGNETEREKGTERETGIASGRLVAIEVEGKGNTGVVAETRHTETGVEIVIATRIVIETGNIFYVNLSLITVI